MILACKTASTRNFALQKVFHSSNDIAFWLRWCKIFHFRNFCILDVERAEGIWAMTRSSRVNVMLVDATLTAEIVVDTFEKLCKTWLIIKSFDFIIWLHWTRILSIISQSSSSFQSLSRDLETGFAWEWSWYIEHLKQVLTTLSNMDRRIVFTHVIPVVKMQTDESPKETVWSRK